MWSDHDIKYGLKNGFIKIEPLCENSIQPASVDLRLGRIFYAYKSENFSKGIIDPKVGVADMMDRYDCNHFYLPPKEFVLGSTVERISLAPNVVSRIEGKSSLGRLGLTVHSTAGFIDPGNQDLAITLEFFNQSPHLIKLSAGMWICQLSFQWTDSPCDVPYGEKRNSRYFGDHETVPSRVERNHGIE